MAEGTTEYLDEAGLRYYDSKRKSKNNEIFVQKETVAGEPERQKVLSDNNLTDELLQKIRNAGDSSFNGSYDNLSDIPTLNGTQLKGSLTDDDLGLATDEELLQAKNDMQSTMEQYVNEKLSSTYTPAGSVETISALPPLLSDNLGKVYNVESSFVTTSDFMEGSGKDYPEGTNVVIVEQSTGIYKYDALAGFIDTSKFLNENSIQPIPNSKIDALFV